MFALCSHSNYNNLNHQLKSLWWKALVCVSKKDLAFCPKMRRGGEAQLIKLSKSSFSMGKYVRSGPPLLHTLCVCAHLRSVHLLCGEVSMCFCAFVVSAGAFWLYLCEVVIPWFLTLVSGARKTANERLMSFSQPQLGYLCLC